MSGGLATIALLTPVVTSSAIFSARRAGRGVDSMSENPFYGVMNFDIAAGQILKGARAAKAIAIATDSEAAKAMDGATNAIKAVSNSNKIAKGVSKLVEFTSNNVNPIICVASGVKVLTSDDKVDTGVREGIALTTMFAAESLTKDLIGLPKDGKTQTAIYKKNLFLKKQVEAVKDYCKTKKTLKYVPGIAKGSFFALGSVLGYKTGEAFVNSILGEQKQAS